MDQMTDVSNSRIAETIDEWVRGERDRKIMKRRLIDGIKYEALAEEFDISVSHARRIVDRNRHIYDRIKLEK